MVLDWGLNLGPPALEISTLPLGYRGGRPIIVKLAFDHFNSFDHLYKRGKKMQESNFNCNNQYIFSLQNQISQYLAWHFYMAFWGLSAKGLSSAYLFNSTYNGVWRGGLTRNVKVLGSSPIKGTRCFLEQETLPLLLSTGWFQEQTWAWFHNQTKINWGPHGRLI